jgi:type IV fimbrial biogenesis protein FimT
MLNKLSSVLIDMIVANCHFPMPCVAPNVGRAANARNGFTMIELLVTISIVGIVMAIAFSALTPDSTASESNSLLGMLQFARTAANRQGQNVIVCPSANASASVPVCSTGTAWKTGWIVLAPASGLCSAVGGATGDLVLQTQQAFTNTDTATFTPASGAGTSFCFNRSGFSAAANLGIVQFDQTPVNLGRRRCTIVSGVGHVQVVTHGKSDALAVACP